MTICVKEEGRLVMELGENVITTTQRNDKTQANKKGKGKMTF